MLNLDLLLSYSREVLPDKSADAIPETIYQTIFEACDRFLHDIQTEYSTIFELIRISSEQKASLSNINTKLKMLVNNIVTSLPRRSYAKKYDIFDSLTIDEDDDQFTEFSLKNVLSLTYELELHYKEYKKNCLDYEKAYIKQPTIEKLGNNSFIECMIEYKDKHQKHKNYFPHLTYKNNKDKILDVNKKNESLNANKKRSKSFDSQVSDPVGESLLDLGFCEALVDSYNQLLQQCNYSCIKKLEKNGYNNLIEAVESYLDDLCSDELFMYIKNRITITRLLIKLMEELKVKSFNAYTDKLLKPINDSMTNRKGSTYSDIRVYNKVDTNKLSLYLSKIKSLPFSQENYSLVEEINVILKDKRRFSDINIEQLEEIELQRKRKTSEAIDMINQNDEGYKAKTSARDDELHNNLYRCYCGIF